MQGRNAATIDRLDIATAPRNIEVQQRCRSKPPSCEQRKAEDANGGVEGSSQMPSRID